MSLRSAVKAFLCVLCLIPGLAAAETLSRAGAVPSTVAPLNFGKDNPENAGDAWWRQPDLLAFGVGYYDALRDDDRTRRAVDFRVEFRSGLSLLPLIAPRTFSSWDRIFQIRPMGGVEATSDGALYGFGGFMFDLFITRHIYIAPNEVVGLYYRGNGKRLGSFVEFRSTFEAGYRFDSNLRIAASVGHISNAKLTGFNPGTEIISGHVYVPVDWIFSH